MLTEVEIHVCSGCGTLAWASDDVVHLRPSCNRREDDLIETVVMVPKSAVAAATS